MFEEEPTRGANYVNTEEAPIRTRPNHIAKFTAFKTNSTPDTLEQQLSQALADASADFAGNIRSSLAGIYQASNGEECTFKVNVFHNHAHVDQDFVVEFQKGYGSAVAFSTIYNQVARDFGDAVTCATVESDEEEKAFSFRPPKGPDGMGVTLDKPTLNSLYSGALSGQVEQVRDSLRLLAHVCRDAKNATFVLGSLDADSKSADLGAVITASLSCKDIATNRVACQLIVNLLTQDSAALQQWLLSNCSPALLALMSKQYDLSSNSKIGFGPLMTRATRRLVAQIFAQLSSTSGALKDVADSLAAFKQDTDASTQQYINQALRSY